MVSIFNSDQTYFKKVFKRWIQNFGFLNQIQNCKNFFHSLLDENKLERLSLACFHSFTKPEPTQVEPTRVEPTRVEPTRVEPTLVEVEPTRVEPTRVEPTREEPTRVEPTRVEPTRVEPEGSLPE
jgi:hypothetical protein